MYQRAMGERFERLQCAVQRFHSLAGVNEFPGWVDTDAPSGLLAGILARCLGTPLVASSGPIRFQLDAAPETETWTRHFPGRTTTSRICLEAHRLIEHLGAARLTFDLCETDGMLQLRLVAVHFLGVRCPGWLLPRVVAEESGEGDRLHFRVEASLPVIGTVAGYRGHLIVGSKETK